MAVQNEEPSLQNINGAKTLIIWKHKIQQLHLTEHIISSSFQKRYKVIFSFNYLCGGDEELAR
jgi:hypothetical protein